MYTSREKQYGVYDLQYGVYDLQGIKDEYNLAWLFIQLFENCTQGVYDL